jgi:hypothetical protein
MQGGDVYASSRGPLFNPDKVLESLSNLLLPEELVLGMFRTLNTVLITNVRLLGFDPFYKRINFSIPLTLISTLSVMSKKDKNDSWYKNNPDLTILNDSLEVRISNVSEKDKQQFENIFASAVGAVETLQDVPFFTEPLKIANDGSDKSFSQAELEPIDSNVPWEKVHKGLKKAIQEHVSGDTKPLFLIVAGSDEAIVALPKSCLVLKRGIMTGAIIGGQRVTSFFYSDITTIEYNGGLMQGRVNILTSSFAGKSDIDTDLGLLSDITSGARFQPNSIEMDKTAYKNARKFFDALDELIAKSKSPAGLIVEAKSNSSIADEIEKLADLHQKGLIDDKEFKELKAKLIQD